MRSLLPHASLTVNSSEVSNSKLPVSPHPVLVRSLTKTSPQSIESMMSRSTAILAGGHIADLLNLGRLIYVVNSVDVTLVLPRWSSIYK